MDRNRIIQLKIEAVNYSMFIKNACSAILGISDIFSHERENPMSNSIVSQQVTQESVQKTTRSTRRRKSEDSDNSDEEEEIKAKKPQVTSYSYDIKKCEEITDMLLFLVAKDKGQKDDLFKMKTAIYREKLISTISRNPANIYDDILSLLATL